MLSCQRHLFQLREGTHYLNGAYMSPLPRAVREAGATGLARKSDPTRITAEDFFLDSDTVRKRFAQLIGSPDPERVAIQPAVSYGMAVVARNTRLLPGERVVVLGEQFPSNYYPWVRLCREHGAELIVVAAPETRKGRAIAWNHHILEAIDERTRLVALANAHWSDGTLFDLRAIRRRTREVDAALVIDGTQTVGALPFNVSVIEPDALVCAGYKPLMGPYGTALAYYGPRYDDGVPLEEGWIARQESDDFARLVQYCDAYRPGANRYDVGERSNPILLPMVLAGLELVLSWTPAAVQDYCTQLVEAPLRQAHDLGFWSEDPAFRTSHLFGLRLPHGLDVEEVRRELAAREVYISVRGSALRVSPHVYNEAADLAALVAALEACHAPSQRRAKPVHS